MEFNYESEPRILRVSAIQWTGSNKSDVVRFILSIENPDVEWEDNDIWVPYVVDGPRTKVPIWAFIHTLPANESEIVWSDEAHFLKIYHKSK